MYYYQYVYLINLLSQRNMRYMHWLSFDLRCDSGTYTKRPIVFDWLVKEEYSGTSIIRTPINRTLNYPNSELTALLEYFAN